MASILLSALALSSLPHPDPSGREGEKEKERERERERGRGRESERERVMKIQNLLSSTLLSTSTSYPKRRPTNSLCMCYHDNSPS